MRKFLLLIILLGVSATVQSVNAQVFDPNDPIVVYNPNNPPQQPLNGQFGKWVITPTLSWGTEMFKSYIYKGMEFRLSYPTNYNPNGTETYPLWVGLHGGGAQFPLYNNDGHISSANALDVRTAINNGTYNGFFLAPHGKPDGEFTFAQLDLIDEIIKKLPQHIRVDLNRVTVEGRSAGASSTWRILIRHPDTFAGATMISGASLSYGDAADIAKYKYTPIKLYQGADDSRVDPVGTRKLVDKIKAAGGAIFYTEYANTGHAAWGQAYSEPDYISFKMQVHKANPHVLFFKSEFCNGGAVNTKAGLTPGFNAYEWQRNGSTITNATGNELSITQTGAFRARFKRTSTSAWSDWSPVPANIINTSSGTINITVSGSTALPTPSGQNSVTLSAPAGYTTYNWSNGAHTQSIQVSTAGNYSVSGFTAGGCSFTSNTVKVTVGNGANAPATPSNFVATNFSETQINLSWQDNANNETAYELYRSTNASIGYVLIASLSSNSQSYQDKNLSANITYYYKLRCINDSGGSGVLTISGSTGVDDEPPSIPQNLVASSTGSNGINLSWQASTDNKAVTGYDIYRNGSKVGSSNNTSYSATGLTAGQIYVFQVLAKDAAGNQSEKSGQSSAYAGTGNGTPSGPTSPSGLTANAASYQRINLSWQDNSNNETSFEVFRSLSSGGTYAYIGKVNANQTSYSDLSLQANTTYYYQVRAVGNTGESPLAGGGGGTVAAPLAARWGFNNNYADGSGNNRTATGVNGPVFVDSDGGGDPPPPPPGTGIQYLALDGTDDYVQIGATGSTGFMHNSFNKRTVALWIKATQTTGNQIIFDEGGSSTGMAIRLINGNLEAIVSNSHNSQTLSTAFTSTAWKHVALVFDAGKFQMFVDGVKVSEVANVGYTTVGTHGDNGGLGGNNQNNAFKNNGQLFTGGIHDVVIFTDALTSAEINSVKDGSISGVSKPKEAYWPLATDYSDASGNNARAEAVGNPQFSTEGNTLVASSKSVNMGSLLSAATSAFPATASNLEIKEGGYAISLDGINDYVQIGATGSTGFMHDAFTKRSVAMWIKANQTSGNQVLYDEGGSTRGMAIRIRNGNLEAKVTNVGNSPTLSTAFTSTAWKHIALVFNSGKLQLYIDGSLATEVANVGFSSVNNHGDNGGLGGTNQSNAFNDNGQTFSGLLDDVMIFEGSLSGSEVVSAMNGLQSGGGGGDIASATTLGLPNPPTAPSNLTASPITNSTIKLHWTDNANNEEGFIVKRALETELPNYLEVTQLGVNVEEFEDTELLPHTKYYYQVVAYNIGGESSPVSKNFITNNSQPVLSAIGNQTVDFGIRTEIKVASNDPDGDDLTYSVTNLPGFASFSDQGDGTMKLSFNPSVNNVDTFNNIQIQVNDGNGGTDSETISVTVNSLVAIGQSKTNIMLIWADRQGETGYQIERRLVGGSFSQVGTTGANITSFDDTGLQQNTRYEYRIRGTGTGAVTNYSNIAGASTFDYLVYLNFNDVNPQGAPWNNTNTVPEELEITFGPLNKDNGQNSGISITTTDAFDGANSLGMNTGNNSGVVPDKVMQYAYWLDVGSTAQLRVSGLKQTEQYNFVFFGSRNGSGNRITNYTINGTTVSLNASFNTNNTVQINKVSPDENGYAYIDINLAAGAVFGYLNALIIQTYKSGAAAARIANAGEVKKIESIIEAVDTTMNLSEAIRVYPNPFSNELKVDVSGLPAGKLEVHLRNVMGAILFSKDVITDGVETSVEIPAVGLPSGMYMLEIKSPTSENKVFRVIKQ